MNNISDEALALFFDDSTIYDLTWTSKAAIAKKTVKKQKQDNFDFVNVYMVFPANFDLQKNKTLLTFYKNILKAIQLDENKVTVQSENNTDILLFTKQDLLISWGAAFSNELPAYLPVRNETEALILPIDEIEKIANNKDLKTQLWQQLKVLFKV